MIGGQLGERLGKEVIVDNGAGVEPTAVLETLPSKTVVFGLLDLGAPRPETLDVFARRLDAAPRRLPTAPLVAAPDCGIKYLSRAVAFATLRALAEGARRVG